jgi:hypothetical protein
LRDPISKRTYYKKKNTADDGGVAESAGPESKPNYSKRGVGGRQGTFWLLFGTTKLLFLCFGDNILNEAVY